MTTPRRFPRLFKAGTALAALLGLLSIGAYAAPDAAAASGSALARLVDADIAAGAPGVVVRIDDGRHRPVTIARQAAWTRADHRLAAGDQFRMGSNTKTMVATVALQLVAEGRLRLSDPVERYLPGLVANGRAITVRMLLNHTSGLPDLFAELDKGWFDLEVLHAITGQVQRDWTPQQLLARAATHPVNFPPGDHYSYSNTNYVALGLILERVTGDSVAHLLQRRILRPLGLHDTYLATDGRSRDGDRLAHGYEPDAAHLAPLLEVFGAPADTAFAGPVHDEHVDVTAISPAWAWAAGAMVSTPRDWDRFLSALLSGRLLPPAQLAEMRTTVEDPTSGGTTRYGLGLMRYTNACGTVWGHTGGIPGFGSQNYTDATGRRTVTVVTTTQFGAKFPDLMAADQRMVDAAVCVMLGR
ncbi:serine hydrolase domain-containing protein [Dactylosporangium sp. NPDC051541]|uniref:serine hydrolase domain-containing protein n=1 Tax=Dactylosporangium sp. NPDC051541 TaxID=3363977 RepID=UPI0037A71675